MDKSEKELLSLLSDATITVTKVYFYDQRTGMTRTWREYYDCPNLEGMMLKRHLADSNGPSWSWIPSLWSVNEKDWYGMEEYTHKNVKMIAFINKYRS